MSKQVGRVLLASVLLAGCTSEVERYCESHADCEGTSFPFCDLGGDFPASEGHGKTCIPTPFDAAVEPPDGGRDDASTLACQPEQTSCVDDVLTECGSDGTVVRMEACALGCAASADRCHELVPSNGLAPYMALARESEPLDLPVGVTIDTATGTMETAGGDAIDAPSALIGAPANGVDVRVFWGKSITIRDATVRGAPALAFVSPGRVELLGTIDLGAAGSLPGCKSGSITVDELDDACPGNAGGSFGDRGGRGGNADAVNGRTASPAEGEEALSPLRGGCGGGDVRRAGNGLMWTGSGGGSGGGALQISSEDSISIGTQDLGGAILANGRAGYEYGGPVAANRCGGGGGGSGGAVLLEAPLVVAGGLASILANGGGGSCYANDGGESEGPSTPGAGAVCSGAHAGNGGNGGTRSTAATNGTGGVSNPPDVPVAHGGGGGGSVGRIRVNTASGSFTSPAAISPVPTVGTVVAE